MSVAPVRTRPGGFSGPQAPALCGPRFSFHAPPHNLPRGRSRRPIPLSRGSLRLGHGFGELRPGPANPHTSAPAPCRRLSFTDGGAWQLKPCRLAAACAMVLPPPHVYSAQLYNHSESEISVEVHYAQHRPDGGDLQEIKCLELRAGEDVPLEEMTRDEGSWQSRYQISRVIARSTGPSNAMTVLEAPMPGVGSPTVGYKLHIKGQPDGRIKLEGSQ